MKTFPTSKPAVKPKQQRKPGVEAGDMVYFKLGDQHTHGRVVCHGQHGCLIEHTGGRERVYWSDVLGHKQRAGMNGTVVDRGEDGFLMEDGNGRRRFVAGELPEPEPEKQQDTPEDHQALIDEIHRTTPMHKSIVAPNARLLFFKGGQIANRPGLTQKKLTDSRGHQTTRWVRTDQGKSGGPAQGGQSADPEAVRGAKSGYGTHDIQPGARVKFQAGQHQGEGEVTVATILHKEAGITDLNTLVTALLHDTVEDTNTTPEELAREFGPEVSRMVMELTKDDTKPKAGYKQDEIDHSRTRSSQANMVKLADKIANLRDILNAPPPWPREEKAAYFDHARQVVDAMPSPHPVLAQIFGKEYRKRETL